MFNGPGRLVFWNKRFAEIFRVEGRLRIGFTLRDILRERIAVGTLAEDPDEYARRATAAAATGKKFRHVFELSDGRKIAVNNEPRPTGGWVSTHEDITERLQVEEERAAIRDQEQRRAVVDSAIAAFRPQMENLIGSVSGNASAMRGTASSLFDSSQRTSERAASAVRSFDETSANVKIVAAAAEELSRSIAEISNQLVQMSEVVQLATTEAQATTARSPCFPTARRRSARSSGLSTPSPNRLICWRLMPPSRRRARATPAAALPWSRPR